MKKYLLVSLYFFIVFPSFANSQTEQQPEGISTDMMNLSFAEIKKRGMTPAQFINLLEHQPWSIPAPHFLMD